MARNQRWILEGLLVLTVTVLLNTRSTEAVDCSGGDVCMNSGTCPTGGQTPCDCSESAYVGDTCADEVCTDDNACNEGTCDKSGTPNVCSCGAYKGKTCLDACETDTDCKNGGTCTKTADPKECDCGDYKGPMCADDCEDDGDCGDGGKCETGPPKTCSCVDETKEGPGCNKDKSGASVLTSFSLMSLFVILTGYLL